jgi:hypothetical protein
MGKNNHYVMVNFTVLWWSGHCRLICRCPHYCPRNKCKRHPISRIGELGESTEEPKWRILWKSGVCRSQSSRAVYFVKFYSIFSMEMAV